MRAEKDGDFRHQLLSMCGIPADEDESERIVRGIPSGENSGRLTLLAEAGSAGPKRRIFCTSNGLSSRGLVQEMRNLVGGDAAGKTCWWIPTALIGEGASPSDAAERAGELRQFGFSEVRSIDVAQVKGQELKRQVEDLQPSCIALDVGNTYYLMHHLRSSGGVELIKKAADEGVLILGASAGAICLGETVQIGFWKGWDDRTCCGIPDVWGDWDKARGLQLLGGRCVFPHAQDMYGNPRWQAEQKCKHEHDNIEVIPLANGEGVVFEGDEVRHVDAAGQGQKRPVAELLGELMVEAEAPPPKRSAETPYIAGDLVALKDLQAADLNGQRAIVLGAAAAADRLQLELVDGGRKVILRVKNIMLVTGEMTDAPRAPGPDRTATPSSAALRTEALRERIAQRAAAEAASGQGERVLS